MPSGQDVCIGQYQACAIRAHRLNATCVPQTGANNTVTTAALVTMTSTYQVETGQEFGPVAACGERVWRVQDQDKIQQLNITMSLALWDFELLEILTGGALVLGDATSVASGRVIGLADRGPGAGNFVGASMEVYAKAAIGTGEVCVSSGGLSFGYVRHVYPRVVMRLDSLEHSNNTDGLLVNLTGFGFVNPAYGQGPLNDWPGTANIPGTAPHAQAFMRNLPTIACGYQDTPVAVT